METDLLTSKFYFPPHRPDLIPRPHLIENLDAGSRGKLTLISAPAGFGKTTVVSEWIRDYGHPTAWLSLDKNDNDPSRFLIYLIAALQRIDSEIGVDVRAVLEESLSPQYEILLARLLSEIEKLPDKTIIVLEDYHLISSKPVHDAINFLIEYLPPSIHLVICGRTDPPVPISRLRVRGEVNEIRTANLRFTKTEVAAFLNDLMGFDLSSDGIAALEARTEGWIASLKLAALSMRGRDNWPEFITKFSGSNRYVIDYLVDEVMTRQPEKVQTFLLRTSILERFCAPLCEYVVGGSEGLDIIGYLDSSNLFLIPLDDRREWYRYHHLFADFLSQRLRESEPGIITELHRRASQWYKNEGWVDEAIQHALAAGDFESATRLVDGIAINLIVRRESNKLLNLINQLPSDTYTGYPMLCVYHAWALLFMGKLDMVEPVLALAEANPKGAADIPRPGYITTVRAYLASNKRDFLQSLDLTKRALEEMSNATPDRVTLTFQGAAVIWQGLNYRLMGNLDEAKKLFIEAGTLNQKAGNFYAALSSFEQLAKLAVARGQLQQAVDIYHSGLTLAQNWTDAEGKRQRALIAAAGCQLGLGAVLYHMNDLDGAETHIQRSANLFELGELWMRMNSYSLLAYLRLAKGQFDACAELLDKAAAIEDSLVLQQSHTSDLPSLTKLKILLSRAKPEMSHLLRNVSQRIESQGIYASDEIDFSSTAGYPYEFGYSDLAYALIGLGRAAEALPLLTRLLEAAIAMERHGDEIYYLAYIALANQALGDWQTALDFIGHALTLAEHRGYVRLFIDEGQPMVELLSSAIQHNISPDYASKLLTAFPKYVLNAVQVEQERNVNTQILAEPLSERELEVLRLIADGYKYKEIADRLIVSINTVRFHTRNVYGKLSVNNRTQAISRAKELSLL